MKPLKRTEHESWALIQANRISGKSDDLFGTSIDHHNSIRLTISQAQECRDESYGHYMPTRQLIEVEMSAMQWAELMTSMNVGSGVPCTIRRLSGKAIEGQQHQTETLRIQDEFEAKVSEHTAGIEQAMDAVIKKLDEAKLSAVKKKEITDALHKFYRLFGDTAPFMHKLFTEACEGTVTEAKAMVDAFVTHAIITKGLEALADDVQKRLSGPSEEPATLPVSE
jgi:hypothetical protein